MALDIATEVETADYHLLLLCGVCELRPPPIDGTICSFCVENAAYANAVWLMPERGSVQMPLLVVPVGADL